MADSKAAYWRGLAWIPSMLDILTGTDMENTRNADRFFARRPEPEPAKRAVTESKTLYCKTCRCARDYESNAVGGFLCPICHEPLLEYSVEQLANLLFDQMKLLDEAKKISEDSRRTKRAMELLIANHNTQNRTLVAEIESLKSELLSATAEIGKLKRQRMVVDRPKREIQD